MSFDGYEDPVGKPPPGAEPPPAAPTVGVGEDIGKGIVGGLGRGVTGMLGGAGSLGDLTRAALTKAGVPEGAINFGAGVARSALPFGMGYAAQYGPSGAQVQHKVEDYTGKFYEPQTVPGQYASTLAEFAPSAVLPGGGGIAARAFNTIVPALASETAGQWTKGQAIEPYARAITGLAAGPVIGKMVTPSAPASAFHQAAVGTLEDAGIPVTAGQRTGSKPLQWLEAAAADMPGSAGRAAEINSAQAGAYDRAITGRLFDPAELTARGVPPGVNLPDPRVVQAGRQSLSDEYTRLSQANQLQYDPRLHNDLTAAQVNYERNVLPSQRSADVGQIRNDILDQFVQGGGTVPGGVYQANRSRLGTLAQGQTNDPYLAGALRDMRTALDAAMQRGLSPADAAAWALNNQRWGNMRQIEPAIARAGENLSPLAVAQSVRTGRAAQSAAQSGDLDPLANAGKEILKPLPQSGTAPRMAWQQLFTIPSMIAASGGAGAGSIFGLPGMAVGALAPFAASRLALTSGGQRYLGNQVLPQNARDIITQALVQQAASQPSGVERNQADQAAYQQKRQENLRKMGLQ